VTNPTEIDMATRLDPDQDLLTALREREPTAAEALITVYGGRAVRLRVDSVDTSGKVTASTWGWVQGDVKGGGRRYFYVPVSSVANTYRAIVQSFEVAVKAPRIEAP
jgi:hypothetical protein